MKLNLEAFRGQHCETTAIGTLLLWEEVALSEPMLFGLGKGLGFIYWKMKSMDHPMLGGRVKPDALTANLAKNLGFHLAVHETGSASKAWEGVREALEKGRPVGLKLDSYYLEYFSKPIHFAAHYAAIYGYDDNYAYLVDTEQQGSLVRTTLGSLGAARSAKGPMASRNLYFTTEARGARPSKTGIISALKANAADYLNPPISNLGYKGIAKAAAELGKHFAVSGNVEGDFRSMALLMERAGTGGSLFRNLYRDFLLECHDLIGGAALGRAHGEFTQIAPLWKEVAALLDQAGTARDPAPLESASRILLELSERERGAMSLLLDL